MRRLHGVSALSAVADPFFVRLLRGLSAHCALGVAALSRDLIPPMLALATHMTDLGWVPGHRHVTEQGEGGWPYVALAAPVMAPGRYARQPVYFGDVIVSQRSDAGSLADALSGRFVLSDPESLSGECMVLDRMRTSSEAPAALRTSVLSGSHLDSMRVVAEDAEAFACVASIVVDMLRSRRHPLLDQVRVVETLGPYPAPPLVVRASLSLDERWELLRGLKSFTGSVAGQKLLYSWNVADVVQVDDSEYDGLRTAHS